MINSILVTGATGKTGRRLVSLLNNPGLTIRAASREPVKGQVRFDWLEPDTHADALSGVDAIYLIPPPLVENPAATVGPFVAAAARKGVRRLVLLSSMGVEFPDEPRGSGRRELESLVRTSGMEWTILRPSGFMQNFTEGFLLPAVRNGTLPNPAGSGKVAMVDAGDIAAVAAKVLTAEGHTFAEQTCDVTGPRVLGFSDVAATISRCAGRPIAAVPMTSRQFLAMLENAGVPSDYAAMLVRDQEAIRDGAAATVADTVARILGRAPMDFEAFAAESSEAWQQASGADV